MSGWLLLMPGILQVLPALGKRTAFINKCWQKADVGLTQERQFTGYAIALTPKLP
jgi:hypothetical protein